MDDELLPIQRTIYQELSRIDDKSAKSYKSALRVIHDPYNPDKLSQAAHSLREVTNIISREISLPQETKKVCKVCGKDLDNKSLKTKLEKQFVGNLGLLPLPSINETKSLIKEWGTLHRDFFLAICHHGKEASEEEFYDKLSQFEIILLQFLKPMPHSMKELDILLSKPTPTQNDINQLSKLLKHPETVRYFFSNLDSPDWLSLLEKNKFFENPPKSIESEKYILTPVWPLSKYLIKISTQKPREVMDIIINLPKTDNFRVHADLIECSIKMPAHISKEIVPNAKIWIKISESMISMKLRELVIKLEQENESQSSLDLFESLIGIKNTNEGLVKEANPYFQIWEYQQILEKTLPFLEEESLSIIKILAKTLNKAIYVEKKENNDESSNYDHSTIWRPAIEDHSQNIPSEDVKELLVISLRNILEDIGKKDLPLLKKALNVLELYNYPIFSRIKLHIYTKYPEFFKNEIEESIKKYFDNYQLLHEYQLLLSKQFCKLNKDLKKWYFDQVEKGPVKDEDSSYCEEWLLRKLQPIKKCFDENSKNKFEDLVSKHGELEDPDFLMTLKPIFGPTSPISKIELEEIFNKKGIDEVVKYLSVWKPSETSFGEPSAEGLGRELNELVKKYPEEFSNKSLKFDDPKIRPVYIQYLFSGLQDSLKEKKLIAWDNVLNLAKRLVFSNNLPSFEALNFEADWNSVYRSLIHLIDEGFNSSPPIPFKRKKDVWDIIDKLSSNEEPDLEHESKYGKDPVFLSINTVRGNAIHTTINYAYWCSKNIEKKILVEEAKGVLEYRLNIDNEPTKTIKSVYGIKLPILTYLDINWVKTHLDQIFPEDRKLWKSSWESYIEYSKLHSDIFEILQPQYKKAVNKLNSPKISIEAKRKLSEHLMQAYIHDLIDLEDSSLIKKFFENATPEIKGHGIWYIGTGLNHLQKNKLDEKKKDKILKRIKNLWEWRIKEAIQNKNKNNQEELKWYGMWFVYSPFDKKWSINQLINVLKLTNGTLVDGYEILDELKNYTNDYYLNVLKTLILFIKDDRWLQVEKIEVLILEISSYNSNEAQEHINDLVSILTKKGYHQFSKFYTE